MCWKLKWVNCIKHPVHFKASIICILKTLSSSCFGHYLILNHWNCVCLRRLSIMLVWLEKVMHGSMWAMKTGSPVTSLSGVFPATAHAHTALCNRSVDKFVHCWVWPQFFFSFQMCDLWSAHAATSRLVFVSFFFFKLLFYWLTWELLRSPLERSCTVSSRNSSATETWRTRARFWPSSSRHCVEAAAAAAPAVPAPHWRASLRRTLHTSRCQQGRSLKVRSTKETACTLRAPCATCTISTRRNCLLTRRPKPTPSS